MRRLISFAMPDPIQGQSATSLRTGRFWIRAYPRRGWSDHRSPDRCTFALLLCAAMGVLHHLVSL